MTVPCPLCGQPADSIMTTWGMRLVGCPCVVRDRFVVVAPRDSLLEREHPPDALERMMARAHSGKP